MAGDDIAQEKWPKIVAHRGASATYPENTLEAFEGAIRAGADVVELDVRLTADHVPVVLHDLDVSRTTDGSGFVHELSIAEVKRLDASRGRGPRVEVPTLREALDVLAGRVGINLELKNLPGEPGFDSPREAVGERVVELIGRLGIEDQILVSSFNWLTIERVRELDPRIPTGFLTIAAIDPSAALVYAASKGHAYVLPQAPALFEGGEDLVRDAHARDVRVGTWTVDDPDVIDRLFRMGVDAIATNEPEMGVPIRDRFREPGTSGDH